MWQKNVIFNMEHRIGEVVTLPDGKKAEVVEGYCRDCVFRKTLWEKGECWKTDYIGECGDWSRTDGKNIIYKEIKEE